MFVYINVSDIGMSVFSHTEGKDSCLHAFQGARVSMKHLEASDLCFSVLYANTHTHTHTTADSKPKHRTMKRL